MESKRFFNALLKFVAIQNSVCCTPDVGQFISPKIPNYDYYLEM